MRKRYRYESLFYQWSFLQLFNPTVLTNILLLIQLLCLALLLFVCLFVYLGQCMLINISKKLKKENMPGYNNIANLYP